MEKTGHLGSPGPPWLLWACGRGGARPREASDGIPQAFASPELMLSAPPRQCQGHWLVPWHPSPTWKLLSSRNLISRRMRSTLIAFSHVLIMHLLMGSKNTALFLNRFLRPGTHSLLCKHRVSKQVPAIPCFPGLPLPRLCFLLLSFFSASARCVPCPTLSFQVLKIPLHIHLSQDTTQF